MCFKYKIRRAKEPSISSNEQYYMSEFSELFVGNCGDGRGRVF